MIPEFEPKDLTLWAIHAFGLVSPEMLAWRASPRRQ